MKIEECFGSMAFNGAAMRRYLDEKTCAEFGECVDSDADLSEDLADRIADGMKRWAIDNGCTHYTHWFQPLNGITAEKYDGFIAPAGKCGITAEFSGKELIRSEPDASSFPSGGLRATFEARGYTAWDPTSDAFIKDGVLCIPTAFCSFNGEALDDKTPLLRSIDAISKAGLRLLAAFGKTAKRVVAYVGPEQEYFLIDRALYDKRLDLVMAGRTLFGARSPKGQELDDHYFGAVKPRVARYMEDLDVELWKVGVFAKTEHNEAAPSQHELATVYSDANTATDHNQLVMETMKKVAVRHGFKCLLHEKPFKGVNGSGKHNNWSIASDDGRRFLEPGDSPGENMLFLATLCSVINAVDKHQDLLRISVASAGNDERLGKNEAPPAIISVFLGDELTGILEAIAEGRNYSKRAKCEIAIGAKRLPRLRRDTVDRNRTSPFAFTGDKFEFRMPGSRMSVAGINTVINSIVADELVNACETLEASPDRVKGVTAIVKDTIENHGRVIFNGNGYSQEWKDEAKRRGLLNLETTPDALERLTLNKNIRLFARHGVFGQAELESRQEILIDAYCKKIRIEAVTMLDMARTLFLPAISACLSETCETVERARGLGLRPSSRLIADLTAIYNAGTEQADRLQTLLERANGANDLGRANFYKSEILPAMRELRTTVDKAELMTAKKHWPVPTYADLLFSEN